MSVPSPRYCELTRSVRIAMRNDSGILLHIDKQRYYSLNSTAMAICTRLSRNESVPQIIAALEAHYRLPTSQIAPGVLRFITRLQELGICRDK